MDRKHATQSVEGYSHALLAQAARSFLDRSEDTSEQQPNHYALGAMMMCCFALEAYFNQLGHALHQHQMLRHFQDIKDFERLAPDKKLLSLISALDSQLQNIPHAWVNEVFRFRNEVAHAKPYSRENKNKNWKEPRPLIPNTDPPWARQARPNEARRFVENMEKIISHMNQASLQKIRKDFPLDIFGTASQVY
ncbi:hypothetical protein [Xanthomonas fragariae]|uniref:hypothetical protein n=1 Tax=Xanthomonas fragariae TaxID=48664 RepID=UPI001ABDBA96|nr:hypothetical protein [Xanthomonas fragariae]UKR52551.1 hypothetical protein K4A87_18950 [Xanthomonas fragariae]WAT14914.1 hypothetical protein OZ429_18745 [Xanthomonas fragariae]